jgi:uncharacterized protein
MGRPAVPLSQFVLKVHSRCDLACDHCYVYRGADQSWRGRPMAMTGEVITGAARRIAEHARAHGLGGVQVILHGGEPLLAGPERLELIARTLRSALDGVCDLDLRIHTNGVQLDEQFCDLFAAHGVKVGISVDGGRAANDRHRRYADGRSSHAQVLAAVALLRLPRYRDLYAGLLCTIDVGNDPVAVYESLLALDPPRIDFLLPHATWDEPPARPAGTASEYADWLIAIFDRWQAGGRPVQVRTFDSIISTSGGGDSLTEALGLGPSTLVVIETDGAYEQADSLKTAFDGAPATGFDVLRHSLDTVAEHPGIAARQQGLAGLCPTCRACPVVTSCGGGLYAHRYRSGTGFANPSVYCPDLLKLITHVRSNTAQRLPGMSVHAVPDAEFRALAAGFGGAEAIGLLAGAQRSLGRALLAAVYRSWQGNRAPGAAASGLQAAWELLTRLDAENPRVLGEVLGHPYVRVWAVHCLDQVKKPGNDTAGDGRALVADYGHLGAIAAAAAIRAGLTARLTVPVVDGAVHLPTLGRLLVGFAGSGPEPTRGREPAPAPVGEPGKPRARSPRPAGLPDDAAPAAGDEPPTATVEVASDTVWVLAGDGKWMLPAADVLAGRPCAGDGGAGTGCGAARWQPVRRLTAPGISVALEDTDPYRDCHQWQAAPRLSDQEFAAWQRQFAAAWQEIRHEHGGYAAALAAGLGTLMPLSAAPAGREVSATARHAFGAVAAALPADHVTLALLLIHEFQHVKLGAVLDLYDLYDPSDRRLFHAPWREDPRPLEGLLQGTYAHLAVTAFWQARRNAAAGPAAETAAQRFAHWRARTCDAIETLAGSGSLTALGMQFVDEMRRSIVQPGEPVAARDPDAGD